MVEDKSFNKANTKEDIRRNAKIEARWHQNNYLNETGNLGERSDPHRPNRSDRWSDLEKEVDLAVLVEDEYYRALISK